ncbi:ABC transporter ATP-binding protein (plasmid) [Bacillus mycoides]|uniref:ABC transporter ATP-binding protein n=1 Tax=Bacillus mycoides TaxID=1405 RepID=UPI0008156E4C|nr:ABC transporter ATP-binding protein [Bacillus mycoides]QWG36585.1 ABC transporter ATP-binding protein [Bacillus mycoides]QWG47996.1 ABC transporter ATP-binding protein [Bacillus mycoides]QWH15132.1 ABC transporter ATP-binding protein [Bacillus mycoides]SCB94475.1 Copper ABC transporter ATPase [Bacillus mycoides]
MTETVLNVSNLKLHFKKHLVLKNISLSLNSRDIYALVGVNGSGKTTFLSIIAGLITQDEGSILINNKKIASDQISMSFQPTSLYSHLTGNDNLKLLSPFPEKAYEILRTLNKSNVEILSKKVKKLSFGQKQRIGIAIALSKKASVYLLDEPTNGLDSTSNKNLIKIIKAMSDEGCSFIVASHEWAIIERCCNRLGMIYEGQIKRELDLSDYMNEDAAPTIQLKTITPLVKDQLLELEEVINVDNLDTYTWYIKLKSRKILNSFQQSLIMKDISIQELVVLHPAKEWEILYNQLSEEGE